VLLASEFLTTHGDRREQSTRRVTCGSTFECKTQEMLV